jgi:hypothetical protein
LLDRDRIPASDVFKFRRFRLNLISFLRLPLGVSENELRDRLKACSVNLHAGYLARAERSAMEWSGRSDGNLPDSYQSFPERHARVNGSADTERFEYHDTITLVL